MVGKGSFPVENKAWRVTMKHQDQVLKSLPKVTFQMFYFLGLIFRLHNPNNHLP